MVGYVEEMKVYSRFHGLPTNRQNPFNITATPWSKAKAMTATPQKSIVHETNFYTWKTWSIRRHYPWHCTILGRKHMYSHLAHSRRVHILDHTTECNVALDQYSCSKTSGMVFCVSNGHKPLGRSLTYQILKMNTVHPQACLEFQLLEGSVNRLGRSD